MADDMAVIAWSFLAIGAAGAYAAWKGQGWLSTIEHALSPSRFTPTSVRHEDTPVGSGSPGNVANAAAHQAAVDYVRSKLGYPYRWAAAGPSAFDCSGLAMEAFAHAGYKMPHNAEAQYTQTRKYGIGHTMSPPPGTLVFFGTHHYATHVGVSIGHGKMIEAPHTGDVVKVFDIATEAGYFGWHESTDPLSHLKTKIPPGASL